MSKNTKSIFALLAILAALFLSVPESFGQDWIRISGFHLVGKKRYLVREDVWAEKANLLRPFFQKVASDKSAVVGIYVHRSTILWDCRQMRFLNKIRIFFC